jgi:hypothetical protein
MPIISFHTDSLLLINQDDSREKTSEYIINSAGGEDVMTSCCAIPRFVFGGKEENSTASLVCLIRVLKFDDDWITTVELS